jgi:hypothetical protein
MPVIQGFEPQDYAKNIAAYGSHIAPFAWVGVGSVCKRSGSPRLVEAVLRAILAVRPDVRVHGFGLKATAFEDSRVASLLYSADSMAWSFAARREGRDANSVDEANAYVRRMVGGVRQGMLI